MHKSKLNIFDTIIPDWIPNKSAFSFRKHTSIQLPIGSSDSAVIASQVRINSSDFSTLIIICSFSQDAARLFEEIPYFIPEVKIKYLSDLEIFPYDTFSPSQEVISNRLSVLYSILTCSFDILIVLASTAMLRMSPPEFLLNRTFLLNKNEIPDIKAFQKQLKNADYNFVSNTILSGEYNVCDNSIEFFPIGSMFSYKIDFLNKKIFFYDVNKKKYFDFLGNTILVLPKYEFPFNIDSRATFCSQWEKIFEKNNKGYCSVYQNIQDGISSAGIESYLPLFFEETKTLIDYFPTSKNPIFVCLHGDVENQVAQFWQNLQERYFSAKKNNANPVLSPEKLYLTKEKFLNLLNQFTILNIFRTKKNKWFLPVPNIKIEYKEKNPVKNLNNLINQGNHKILICADSLGRKETLLRLFHQYELYPKTFDTIQDWFIELTPFSLIHAPIHVGFFSTYKNCILISESDLFSQSINSLREDKYKISHQIDTLVRDISELKIGDPIVHIEYGIGLYNGLKILNLEYGEEEFISLKYANDGILYVPIQKLSLISRYIGTNLDNIHLNHLGSESWEKTKRKIFQQINDTAATLLNIYTKRSIQHGHAFQWNTKDYQLFIEEFAFTETLDQKQAISEVIKDMESKKSMDRLVCGDVGFGKTEIALRASFIATLDNKQVAILVPTTLLAEQHMNTWINRFKNWPITISELSRFKNKKEIKIIIEKIKEGTIDIVIGTHKLLSSTLEFKDLGLIIIDEEHHFGVEQKEFFRNLYPEADILMLSATPIPRTLCMALDGLKNFSVISTAPKKRLSIKTIIQTESDQLIQDAINREVSRGGQVYFLYNDIDTMDHYYQYLKNLLKNIRIIKAHGQMHERELERAMKIFISKKAHVLLCTTIIETGIDIPNANTIIVHRADKFGLSQLYQLRGRVGRSSYQAYAYFIIPNQENLTEQAKLRLEAIQDAEELGSGFYLARKDLEIRGSGEILGEKQSGHISMIGFQLYTDMLNCAIKLLETGEKKEYSFPINLIPDITLGMPCILPNNYCSDVRERLLLYKKLAIIKNKNELFNLQEEVIDRFGALPEQTKYLFEIHYFRLKMQHLKIKKINACSQKIVFQFHQDTIIHPMRLVQFLQNNPDARLIEQNTLQLLSKRDEWKEYEKRIATIWNALNFFHDA